MLPTLGSWVPWYPFCLPPVYPFFYWLGAVLDQRTRKVVAFKLFLSQPSAKKATALLDLPVKNAGKPSKHIISDRGAQFSGRYRDWCRTNGVKPRFGAVGQRRSIALIERFWRSLKYEHWFRLAATPWAFLGARREIEVYIDWYHEHRPHQALGGCTPTAGRAAEPDERGPLARGDPALRAQRLAGLRVRVEPFKGRRHLPVVSLIH
jgi:transposase InsO family protein